MNNNPKAMRSVSKPKDEPPALHISISTCIAVSMRLQGKRFERDRLLKNIQEAEEEVGSLDKRHEEALDKAQSEMKCCTRALGDGPLGQVTRIKPDPIYSRFLRFKTGGLSATTDPIFYTDGCSSLVVMGITSSPECRGFEYWGQ
ncbi:hypothetical protein TNCV_4354121 [Trichonephila clavipes]|nr:hypothetical protein TNCV_4354121 [Trichonephila clavipes]